jgi:hypothetical protein
MFTYTVQYPDSIHTWSTPCTRTQCPVGSGIRKTAAFWGTTHQGLYPDTYVYCAKPRSREASPGPTVCSVGSSRSMVSLPTVRFRLLLLLLPSPAAASVAVPAAAAAELPTENLMTAEKLGNFEDEGWEGYACSFADWATCVNSTTSCSEPASSCSNCVAKRGRDSRCLETMRGCLAGGSANPRECYQRANNCDHALGDAGCSKGQIDSFCTEGVP